MTTDEWFSECARLANELKEMTPILATDVVDPHTREAKSFDFAGVYIFSEERGRVIYVGESQNIPERFIRHFGRLRRNGSEVPIGSRSTPHRTAHDRGETWPWDYLRSQYARAVNVPDEEMRDYVERALIREFNPIGNP